jgi:hypothetical protein
MPPSDFRGVKPLLQSIGCRPPQRLTWTTFAGGKPLK